MTLFLGLDGGGTKTAVVLAEGDGRVLARWRGPACSWLDGGVAVVADVVARGTHAVLAEAGRSTAEVTHAFFGVPGHGESSGTDDRLDALPAEALGHRRYTVGNDMLAGWAGSLGGRDGINVIAGTGSMAYGERGSRTHRVGGWSELIGDEGSAHWIARRGLNAFSRMADGRLPRTPLYDLLRARTGITDDLDLVGLVMHDWQAGRTEVATLSRVVTAAAAAGDPAAGAVLDAAADELVEQVRVVADRIGDDPDGQPTAVSTSGGVFSDDGFRTRFASRVVAGGGSGQGNGAGPRFALVEPVLPPDLGAVVYAMRVVGHAVPATWTAAEDPARQRATG